MAVLDANGHLHGDQGRYTTKSNTAPAGALAVEPAVDIPDVFYGVWEGPAECAADAYSSAVLTAVGEPGDPDLGRAVAEFGAADVLRLIRGDIGVDDAARAAALFSTPTRLVAQRARLPYAADVFEKAARAGITVRTAAEGGIPDCFADLGDTAPLALWTRGNVDLLDTLDTAVSVTGARAATSYGEHAAAQLADALQASGRTIVTGGSYGIDAAATRASAAAGDRNVIILASGPDRPYPAGNTDMINSVAEHGGLVMSELPPGATATKWRFMQRSRLLAAASAVTVVVEAGFRSGALNVAQNAAFIGRKVAAVPGPITSAASSGANELIASGRAQLVASADDVIELARA
ncbi:DNA-processing protein DprA [Microbacterium sp.]|uniref:DNA-processing protein DprA n=1 Tax=Microbacterium sp. TaxID=51671 RepID=UPI003A88F27F